MYGMIDSMQPVLLKLKPNTGDDEEGPDIDLIRDDLCKQFKKFIFIEFFLSY